MELTKIKDKIFEIFDFIYRKRFFIGVFLFILLVLLEIHGSSIGIYNKYIQPEENKTVWVKPLIGENQDIRSDEWSLHTPMALSQKYDNFNINNSILRAEPTNMATTYNQPVKALFSIVKPFHLGYLLLDDAKGLSWFWVGRTIFLFLITFEFFRIITRKNRLLSMLGAVLVVFSPAIQWWFAVNDIVEQFFWGELGVVALYHFINSDSKKRKLLLSVLIGLCISGFALCFYPAWQVPLFYIFTAIAIGIIYESLKDRKILKSDFCFFVISIIIALLIILSAVIPSLEAIELTKNTIYPGQRYELGGKFASSLFFYLLPESVFFFDNICEFAQFLGLFPLPAMISIVYLFKIKFEDKLIFLLLLVQIFIAVYLCFGFSESIAQATGMILTTRRAAMMSSFIDIVLLLRLFVVSNLVKYNKNVICLLYALICAFNLYIFRLWEIKVFPVDVLNSQKMMTLYVIVMPVVLFFLAKVVLNAIENIGKYRQYLSVTVIIFSFFCFGFINPVVKGLDAVKEIPVGKEISRIQSENPGRWLVVDNYSIANFPIIFGAPTINSTNIYPNFKLWHRLDADKQYETIYNRFAHISVVLSNGETVFMQHGSQDIKPFSDTFILYLAFEDLPKLGVNYIFSTQMNDEKYETAGGVEITKIYDRANSCIYKVTYKNKALELYNKYYD